MMKPNVFYFGADTEVAGSLEKHFQRPGSSTQFHSRPYGEGTLVQSCCENPPHMIFIDFSDTSQSNTLLEEVVYLKKVDFFRGVLLIALFSDEENFKQHIHVFSSGFQLSFIRGGDLQAFLNDALKIGIGEAEVNEKFAMAKGLSGQIEIGVCASLVNVGLDGISIDTDVQTPDGSLVLGLSLFSENAHHHYNITQRAAAPHTYPMSHTFQIELPLRGPWSNESDECIDPAKVEEWVDLHSATSDLRQGSFHVFSAQLPLAAKLYPIQATAASFIRFSHRLPEESLREMLTASRPGLLFYELSDEKTGLTLSGLTQIIQIIRQTEDYHPFIVVSQSLSTSIALQKLVDYPMLLSISQSLDVGIIENMAIIYVKKKLELHGPATRHIFAPGELDRHTHVLLSAEVTALSETELHFTTPYELPLFSVFTADAPVSLHATITRSMNDPKRPGTFSYAAILHGMTESQLVTLRYFVNQAIHNPSIEFAPETPTLVEASAEISPEEEALPDNVVELPKPQALEELRFPWREGTKIKSKL